MKPIFAIAKLLIKEIFRKKDFYVALILIAVILFYSSQLRFYNVENVVRYLMDLGLMLIFYFSVILTVALAARQYPSEIQNRTCQVLLAKPIGRGQFVLGKYCGSLFAGMACFAVFYAVFLVMIWPKSPSISAGVAVETLYLFCLNLAVVSAMAGALSYFLTTSANVSVTLVLYLLITTYGSGLKESSRHLFWMNRFLGEGFYYLLPHFEFFDMRQRFVHHWGSVPLSLVFFLTAYAAAYVAVFLLIAWLKLKKAFL